MRLTLEKFLMRQAFAHIAQPGHDSFVIRNRATGEKSVICKTRDLRWEKRPHQRPER